MNEAQPPQSRTRPGPAGPAAAVHRERPAPAQEGGRLCARSLCYSCSLHFGQSSSKALAAQCHPLWNGQLGAGALLLRYATPLVKELP